MGIAHWIAAVVGIFAVTVIFLPLIPVVTDHLMPTFFSNVTAEGRTSLIAIQSAFLLAPVILIVGLIIYAIASTERREYDSTRDEPEF